jgi:hypothetical protein
VAAATRAHGQTAPGKNALPQLRQGVRTTGEVARKVGLGSGDTYERAKSLFEEIEQEPDAGMQPAGGGKVGNADTALPIRFCENEALLKCDIVGSCAALARKYVFLDESGNFDFSPRGSRYFSIGSIAVDSCDVGSSLQNLRRELAWNSIGLNAEFHATEDQKEIRNRVFDVICEHPLRVDVTIMEKPKARPHLRADERRFYKETLFLHLKYLIPRIATADDELLVVAAAWGTKKERADRLADIIDVLEQLPNGQAPARGAFWPAAAEPCLQIADYCCWAVHRKWERGDARHYDRIAHCVHSEFDVFRNSKTIYY